MATKKISELTAISTVSDTDVLPIVDSSELETKKITGSQLKTYVQGDLNTRLTTAESDINNVDTRLTTAESDINNVDTRLTTAEGEIDNLQTGWVSSNETWTYVSFDSTTKTGVVNTNLDLTGYLSVGMKVKFTQNGGIKYGIIVAITSTQISLYMGNNYTLTNATITLPYYAMVQNPYGFPADLVNPVNANLKSKIITITRDGQGANGDVSYTGVGFKPTSVKAIMVVVATLYKSNGFADSAGTSYCQYTSSANIEQGADWLVSYSNQNSWVQHGKVKSYDADGLTITWEKIGTPVEGTMKIYLLCER